MSAPAPGHAEWADAVGAYLLGALPPDEADGFEAHMHECPLCRRDVEQLRIAAEALPASVPQISPPPALKDRIMAVVESEAELLAAAGRRADQPDVPRTPERRRRRIGEWLLRPGVALACAAVLLAAGGVAGVLLAGGEDTRTVVAGTQAPDADVRLEIRDDAATLTARNLPAPPRGRIYQVWIKRPGQDPVPSRTVFDVRPGGEASVRIAEPLDGVEAVLVTAEPSAGSPAPTSAPVITTNLT
jgi:anti-sigma-K factor RskA